jgi:hypothetical protein
VALNRRVTALHSPLAFQYFPYAITNVGIPAPSTIPWSETAFAIDTLAGPAPCNSGANYAGTIINGVGSVVNQVTFTSLNKNEIVTINKRYMQF